MLSIVDSLYSINMKRKSSYLSHRQTTSIIIIYRVPIIDTKRTRHLQSLEQYHKVVFIIPVLQMRKLRIRLLNLSSGEVRVEKSHSSWIRCLCFPTWKYPELRCCKELSCILKAELPWQYRWDLTLEGSGSWHWYRFLNPSATHLLVWLFGTFYIQHNQPSTVRESFSIVLFSYYYYF